MRQFLDETFLLQSQIAQRFYQDYARDLPIIDYHCHLSPEDLARDRKFENLTQIWLSGDHYKWRAMRAHGINEAYITGNAPDEDKFLKWAETVPYTLGNPLYHWTHLELQRTFGIRKILNGQNALEIYHQANEILQLPDFHVRNILLKMKVEVICTTDDPADSLEHHRSLKKEGFKIRVLPTWRPDKAMAIENPAEYTKYLERLEVVSNKSIRNFNDLLDVLQQRHDFFGELGCRASDHGLETFYAEDFSEHEIQSIFRKVRDGVVPDSEEVIKFRSSLLYHFAVMDHAKGWVQQFHVDVWRNVNTRMFRELGGDSGFDTMADAGIGRSMIRFLDRLEQEQKLTRTIVYNLNPRENELIANILNSFNDGTIPGKMQYGAAWWFLDNKKGIEDQLTTLANFGLLSHFVGMLTDSRSFLSYPRHEYFRRILCNFLGTAVENGEMPSDENQLHSMIHGICYLNARHFFSI